MIQDPTSKTHDPRHKMFFVQGFPVPLSPQAMTIATPLTNISKVQPQSLVYASKRPAREGASRLVALPYLGLGSVRGYRDAEGGAWLILADLFKVLTQGVQSNIRKRVKSPEAVVCVRAWVDKPSYPDGGSFDMVQSISEAGMVELLGVSLQAPSIEMLHWAQTVAAPTLRTAE